MGLHVTIVMSQKSDQHNFYIPYHAEIYEDWNVLACEGLAWERVPEPVLSRSYTIMS
jgi:hypothetical protein